MRERTGSLQISPRRLLSLLLIQIFLAVAVDVSKAQKQRSSGKDFKQKHFKIRDILSGGTPSFRKFYALHSPCSQRFVQMKYNKEIDALGMEPKGYAILLFESTDKGYIRIRSNVVDKYLCFNRKGRLRTQHFPRSARCYFREIADRHFIKLQSVAKKDWYVGFNKRGGKMKGFSSRTHRRRRRCQVFTKWPMVKNTSTGKYVREQILRSEGKFNPRNSKFHHGR